MSQPLQKSLDFKKPAPSDGLTAWASGPPPMLGWWGTRLSQNPDAMQPQCRWWDGHRWSLVVLPDDDEEEVLSSKATPTTATGVEWRGFTAPAAGGYDYPLLPSPRTTMAHKMRPVKKTQPPARVKLLGD